MKRISLIAVIALVMLTACNKDKTQAPPEEEKYTITFDKNEYTKLSRMDHIFATGEANSNFIIEKAVDRETEKVVAAEEDGFSIKTDMFSAKKIAGHNRLQINIKWNPDKKERTIILYVKNGEERGKLTFNQELNDPELIGGEGTIMFDPILYDIDAKGGEIETAIAKDVGIAPYIFRISVKDDKSYSPTGYHNTFFKVDGLIATTVIDLKDESDQNLTVGAKLKLNVEPNNTGKDREIYVEVENEMAMPGYVIVYQSAK